MNKRLKRKYRRLLGTEISKELEKMSKQQIHFARGNGKTPRLIKLIMAYGEI